MNIRNLALAAAVGSLLSMSMTTASPQMTRPTRRSATASHRQARMIAPPTAIRAPVRRRWTTPRPSWKYVPKGECEKMGGKTAPPAKM